MADHLLGYYGRSVQATKDKMDQDLKSRSMPLKGLRFTLHYTSETRLTQSPNVLAYLPGSDPKLKDEYVVIGAHLDHLGQLGDYIFNGADDNGSGSVGVLLIARAFARNTIKPRRSILFALWTGEEHGLLGSLYYIRHPFVPLKKTVANITMDMIGRIHTEKRFRGTFRRLSKNLTDQQKKLLTPGRYMPISLDGGYPALYDTLKKANRYVGLSLYLRKSSTPWGGSDHAPFGIKKIPWLVALSAFHDDYHKPSDSLRRIVTRRMEQVSRLLYLTAFALADEGIAPTGSK
jgi:Zn-dependent M28 family amino/carboxypeptidase